MPWKRRTIKRRQALVTNKLGLTMWIFLGAFACLSFTLLITLLGI